MALGHRRREWLGRVGVKTLFIEPGSPWENGYVESLFRLAPGRAAGTGSVRHAARGQKPNLETGVIHGGRSSPIIRQGTLVRLVSS